MRVPHSQASLTNPELRQSKTWKLYTDRERGLRRRRFFEDLYGDRLLFHHLDQSDIRDVTNNTGELWAVIAYHAGSIDDHVLDLPFVRTVNQPKVDRLVDHLSLHLNFDYSKDILPKLP